MEDKQKTGIGKGLLTLAGIVATAFYSCSKKPTDVPPVVAELYLNVIANQDSNYCKAEIAASASPCSVYTEVRDGDKVLAKKGAYVTDTKDITAFMYDNIPRPFDGEVVAFGPNSPDTARKYFAFTTPEVDSGVVGDTSGTFPPENRPVVKDTTYDTTKVDTNKVSPPDTTSPSDTAIIPPDTGVVDSSGNDIDDGKQKGGYKKMAEAKSKKKDKAPANSSRIMYAQRQRNVFYKPRQYCGKV